MSEDHELEEIRELLADGYIVLVEDLARALSGAFPPFKAWLDRDSIDIGEEENFEKVLMDYMAYMGWNLNRRNGVLMSCPRQMREALLAFAYVAADIHPDEVPVYRVAYTLMACGDIPRSTGRRLWNDYLAPEIDTENLHPQLLSLLNEPRAFDHHLRMHIRADLGLDAATNA